MKTERNPQGNQPSIPYPFDGEKFLALPPALIHDPRLTLTDQMVYLRLLEQADWRTGIWKGTAYRIVAASGLHLRTVQRSLGKLEDLKYIRRFPKPNGDPDPYEIALHGYVVRVDEQLEPLPQHKRLNAFATEKVDGVLVPVYTTLTATATATDENDHPVNGSNSKGLPRQEPRQQPRKGNRQFKTDPESNRDRTATRPSVEPRQDRQFKTDVYKEEDFQDVQDGQDQPTNPPDRSDGWLVRRIRAITQKITDTAAELKPLEVDGLLTLEEQYGHSNVLWAFLKFTWRAEGFDGLIHPVSVFLQQAPVYMALVPDDGDDVDEEIADEMKALEHDSYLRRVSESERQKIRRELGAD